MKICAFLWTYFGYPTSSYEGVNVEQMRYDCGRILAQQDTGTDADYVAGVPDSGTAHAIGYANESGIPFARPFIKYTPTWPRSFMPQNQAVRNQVAHMKLIPVDTLIRDKRLLFIDDSVVRGTQMRETVDFLYNSGAKEVHIRPACPPIMFGCKYLNFSRSTSDMDLITHTVIHELEGEEGFRHLEEYIDAHSERYGRDGRGHLPEAAGHFPPIPDSRGDARIHRDRSPTLSAPIAGPEKNRNSQEPDERRKKLPDRVKGRIGYGKRKQKLCRSRGGCHGGL